MVKRILIDAVHPEEIRVVLTENNRLQDFDFETSTKKQIKSNIYLAKITRVEPSLQAAFVEYGGNKQGFLPFSEIHPDYYNIPVSDQDPTLPRPAGDEDGEEESQPSNDNADDNNAGDSHETENEMGGDIAAASDEDASDEDEAEDEEQVDVIGDEAPEAEKRSKFYKKYKIQEVIKRNQVILVQVIKEERGNKGASLTTYLSIAGRYCVFMPNSDKQGGISRRVTESEERNRLRAVLDELNLAEGTSLIMRTAGITAPVGEIKRDYEHLLNIWEKIKQQTMSSKAPTLIYEEGNIIRRTLRDLYSNSIDEIVVEGEDANKEVLEVIKTLSPSSAEKVKEYTENLPIFWKYQVEDALAELYDNKVFLRSGGYIVINSTEALVAIDVNSGRSTRERNVEETATKTNLEAAYEIARQLRLRDLAGLIVIDFIDMMELRNRKAVERTLKDALRLDRAKIQVGRISPFGLLEMSRQRLRSSFLESNTVTCPTCNGTGIVRSTESTVVRILRAIDNEAGKGGVSEIKVSTPFDIAFYLLNKKKDDLSEMEELHKLKVLIEGDLRQTGHNYVIETTRNGNTQKTDSNERQKITYASPDMLPEIDKNADQEMEERIREREMAPSNITEIRDGYNSRRGRDHRRGGGKRRGNNRNRFEGRNNRPNGERNSGDNRDRDGRRGDFHERKKHGAHQQHNRHHGKPKFERHEGEEKTSSVLKSIWQRIVN